MSERQAGGAGGGVAGCEGGAGGATPGSPQDGGALAAGPRAERLGGLLQDLLASRGRFRTAQLLGVSERTLQRAEAEGRLTEQLCRALERYEAGLLESAAQSADGVDAVDAVDAVDTAQELARLRRRLDKLERVQQAVSDGLPEVPNLPEAPDALARLEASVGELERRVAALEQGGDGGDGGRPAGLAGASVQAGSASVRAAPHRRYPDYPNYPELVMVEAEPEEERFYGAAMETITQWRQARLRREEVATPMGSALERLRADERLLELELALVGEHGLTLPPADRPWDGIRRQSELRVLREALTRVRAHPCRDRERRRVGQTPSVHRGAASLADKRT